MALDDSHPAKRFLSAFIECRDNCVGLELDPESPIDQEWDSSTDGRRRTFSGFAYAFLSRDIPLDDFDQSRVAPDEPNINWPWDLARFKALARECASAARASGNSEVLALVVEVLDMLRLWDAYLSYRKQSSTEA